ncbi:uncharacterized protein LOC122856302 [Aphidius gifuensis]|uniref:uncharacterized protein LOC122856302 n=1 Tax=Aphidius gifuensis TaxID=684658 RepID=UPI001CDB6002|nr:uncharacterized protein LOC122856302 [Aphidius gifuensis]
MKIKNSVFCLFLLIIYMNKYVDCFDGVSYNDAKDMFETFTNIVNRVNQAKTQAETGTQYDANPWGDQTSAILDALINKVDAISSQLNVINDLMNSRVGKIEKMIIEVTYGTQKDNLLRDFNKASNRIQFAYEKLLTFANAGKNITKRRIKNFIEEDIENLGTEGVEGNLATIFDIITSENLINVGSSEQSLLALITKKELEKGGDVCGRHKSSQLIIYQFFLTVCSIEILGATTLAYGYALNEILQKSENKTDLASDEIPVIKEEFKKRVTAYSNKFAKSIESVSRAFRNCDPVESHMHIRDVTFTEMWGLTQSIVLSEFSLASRRSCAGTCANVHNKPNNFQFCYNKPMHGDRVYKTDTRACWWWYNAPEKPELCPTPRRCHGLMSDCIEITNAKPCMLKNDTRRYQFIKDVSNDKSYGLESECKGYEADFEWSKDDVYDCTFCLCTCDDNIYTSESVHMISLKLARSDTANNK